jgi:competence protein ComEA
VDLNAASPEELDRLPGIGPVLAGRIVEYRRRHGRFTRIEELLAVRGIGPRLLERLRGRVRL